MNYLPMNKLGALEISPKIVQFGIFLPGVDSGTGYAVSVKIIHETDQYLQAPQPTVVAQAHSVDATYGDYWSGQIDLNTAPPPPGSSTFGQPGRYVYRYVIHSPTRGDIDFIIDPFSREVGVGRLSAITVGSAPYAFSANETKWKTPPLNAAIIYELMISEFRNDIDRTVKQLPYLADLGINCIEVMPVSNVLSTIDWGYDPIGYFCVAERFGKASDFQRFVDLCHQNGIAVAVDSVYGHTGGDFAYTQLYNALQNDLPNPFNGGRGDYGTLNDFSKQLTQDYFYSANQFWLDTFHVDGFRFDDVPEYWDSPTGPGYANLVYSTYQYVKSKAGATDHYQRFFDAAGNINLIQIAEYLPNPPDILNGSYSTGTWQDGTLYAAASYAVQYPNDVAGLVFVDHAIAMINRRPPSDGGAVSPPPVPPPPAPPHDGQRIAFGMEDDPNFSKLSALDRELHLWATTRDRGKASSTDNPMDMLLDCVAQADAASKDQSYRSGTSRSLTSARATLHSCLHR